MPGYLSVKGIQAALQQLVASYPGLVSLIALPEASLEGRACRAIKIAAGTGERRGVLLLGGVHARELNNPDLLLNWAFTLCKAYTTHTGMTFGGKSYSTDVVRVIVEGLDLFVFPLVNPDGRAYVQAPAGDSMWRKNRNPNGGDPCKGVDINRNFDFLWSSGIGTSASKCSEIYKGTGPFSEPETRNVRWLLDAYPRIAFLVDVHSYSELILYPWGDDENQATSPAMNFHNPAFNGQRGNVGDAYREYIPQAELNWCASTAIQVRDAIAAVRGTMYTAQQDFSLYATTGTSSDYAYTRRFVDAAKQRVYGFCIETGNAFQPAPAEALQVQREVAAGLTQFCLASLCAVEQTMVGTALEAEADRLSLFRDREMLRSKAGRRYVALLADNTVELLTLLKADPSLRTDAQLALKRVVPAVPKPRQRIPKVIDSETIAAVVELLDRTRAQASPALQQAIDAVAADLPLFENRTIAQGLKAASVKPVTVR